MLAVDDLVRTYGAVRALDGMTFAVPPGTVTGFLGPNGSGKTTTMRAIFGLTALDRGRVTWDGRPIDRAIRQRFGYLPEERGLYPKMTVIAQLVYFGELRGLSRPEVRRRSTSWLDQLGLASRAEDKVETLSLGNQQRVQLIACLLHEPDVLILDEPFSGLDPVAVQALSAVLVSQAERGATVLFSSHQLDLVQDLCQWAIIVNRGRTVIEGSIEQLTVGTQPVLEIDVPTDADGQWAHPIVARGERVLSAVHGRVRIELADERRDERAQAYLDAARAAGDVRRFGFEHRSLAEVFLAEVGSPADAVGSPADAVGSPADASDPPGQEQPDVVA